MKRKPDILDGIEGTTSVGTLTELVAAYPDDEDDIYAGAAKIGESIDASHSFRRVVGPALTARCCRLWRSWSDHRHWALFIEGETPAPPLESRRRPNAGRPKSGRPPLKHLGVYLAPDLYEWVLQQGGGAWMRELAERERKKE